MGLKHLGLRDFVIVRELELEFDEHGGFTALTGETGAGKSILLDALQLLLGERGSANRVREGATQADLSAVFAVQGDALKDYLQSQGFETAVEEGELILRRTLDVQGKSRAWIQGTSVSLAQLRDLAPFLLEIYGQHAWATLTRSASARECLDAYAQIDTKPLNQDWQAMRQAQLQLDEAHEKKSARQAERTQLTWEIEQLEPVVGHDPDFESFNQAHARLSHAQALLEAASLALGYLDDEQQGVLKQLRATSSALVAQASIESWFGEAVESLDSVQVQLEDLRHGLQNYAARIDLDPQSLAELDERMSRWISLARRHQLPPQDLPQRLAEYQARLATLDALDDLDALQAAFKQAEQDYLAQAKVVSAKRNQAAARLGQAVTESMQELGMAGGRLEIALESLEQGAAYGLEDVVFLVSPHVGVSAQPIAKIASGGELSRIALAIAVCTSEMGSASTLIFDEVDAGIGGAVAQAVGRFMQRLGETRQVLAVTHLAQVAASAHHHFRVEKQQSDTHTSSTVVALDEAARIEEIARMLSGDTTSDVALAHAKSLLVD